jgi:CDP-diacylglycerol--serine O-phosphatidyltransferase
MEKRRLRRQKLVAVAPTMFTLGNAACGFAAITFAMAARSGSDPVGLLFAAGVMVIAAMFFDMVDGSVARLTRQTSDFGAQLDSLCDVISFGVAPALIVLNGLNSGEFYHPRLIWCLSVLFVLCVVLRLARFNVETSEDDSHFSFSGLPSPAAAGTVASFAIAGPGFVRLTEPGMPEHAQELGAWLMNAEGFCLPLLALVLGCLMVSRIRYPHVFNLFFRGQQTFPYLIQLVFALVAVFAFHELAAPLIFLFFVLASPVRVLLSNLTAHIAHLSRGEAREF